LNRTFSSIANAFALRGAMTVFVDIRLDLRFQYERYRHCDHGRGIVRGDQ